MLIKILPPSGLGAGAENVTVNEEKDDVSDNGTGVVKEYRFVKFGEMLTKLSKNLLFFVCVFPCCFYYEIAGAKSIEIRGSNNPSQYKILLSYGHFSTLDTFVQEFLN